MEAGGWRLDGRSLEEQLDLFLIDNRREESSVPVPPPPIPLSCEGFADAQLSVGTSLRVYV